MNAAEAIAYINSTEWYGSNLGLARVEELLHRMGDPQKRLRFVHVAGTNGKGSVCAMLASVLRQAGYKTGLFTSPYIHRFQERIQVDGVEIPDRDLAEATEKMRVCAEEMEDHPTTFTMLTAVAMEHFARQNCDVVVLEVGLGGRLDATNVIDAPELAIITRLGFDHTRELGNTLAQIAAEKAGIIKQGGDVLLYPQEPQAAAVVAEVCRQKDATLHTVDFGRVTPGEVGGGCQCFTMQGLGQVHLSLLGSYQPYNAATVITAAEILRGKGWAISDEALLQGLAGAKWIARFELLCQTPPVVVDGGHNPQGAQVLVESLQRLFPGAACVFVMGVLADKSWQEMAEIVAPLAKRVLCLTPDNPRALPAEQLADYFTALGVTAAPCSELLRALEQGLAVTQDGEVLCVFGSLYMAGAVRGYFLAN